MNVPHRAMILSQVTPLDLVNQYIPLSHDKLPFFHFNISLYQMNPLLFFSPFLSYHHFSLISSISTLLLLFSLLTHYPFTTLLISLPLLTLSTSTSSSSSSSSTHPPHARCSITRNLTISRSSRL